MRRAAAGAVAAVLALLALASSCGGSSGGGDRTVTVDGRPVAVASLVDAHAALCEAADRPGEARTLFFDRAHDALHTVARGLDGVDRPAAARLLEAKQQVESQLGGSQGAVPADLAELAGVYRAGLGRLAIEARPCVE